MSWAAASLSKTIERRVEVALGERDDDRAALARVGDGVRDGRARSGRRSRPLPAKTIPAAW